MKLAALLLATISLGSNAAELKVLKNYDKVTKHYSSVEVSSTEKPLALTAILSETDGLCYKGTPTEIADLVESMAVIANSCDQSDVVYGKPVVTANAGTLAVTIPYQTTWEKGTWSWGSIPACVR